MKIVFAEYPMILRDYLTNLCEFYIEYVHLLSKELIDSNKENSHF